jgi:hypothetical protein
MIKGIIPKEVAGASIVLMNLSTSGGRRDPVQEDLIEYLNKRLKVVNLWKEAEKYYDSVGGENYTDDQTMYITVKSQVLPRFSEVVEKAEEIQPATKEVSDLHEIYVESANLEHNAIIILLSALERSNVELTAKSNENFAKARRKMREWIRLKEELCETHNVVKVTK